MELTIMSAFKPLAFAAVLKNGSLDSRARCECVHDVSIILEKQNSEF